MKVFRFPKENELAEILKRPGDACVAVEAAVRKILADVKCNGDAALRAYGAEFDKVEIDALEVTVSEFDAAETAVSDQLKGAIRIAKTNIETGSPDR